MTTDQTTAPTDPTATLPKVSSYGPPFNPPAPRPAQAPIPVPPEFRPRPRPMAPPPLRIHPAQWDEHLAALAQLRKVLLALVSLLAAVLVMLGYVTLEAVQIVSSIHSLDTVRAGLGI